ncbi:hypothetical protein Tsubulata_043796 [Turnera subulata]|uniref:chloroplast protein-transporting ATPase n=1 Tax=Turnera subulata TaxID=218843 RepID=A0A9Q0FAM3_9ROSI|nr:hypothetical protein Tsubulata_043796 [Turnera subulata]
MANLPQPSIGYSGANSASTPEKKSASQPEISLTPPPPPPTVLSVPPRFPPPTLQRDQISSPSLMAPNVLSPANGIKTGSPIPHLSTPPGPPVFTSPVRPAAVPFRTSPATPQPVAFSSGSSLPTSTPPHFVNGSIDAQHQVPLASEDSTPVEESAGVLFSAHKILLGSGQWQCVICRNLNGSEVSVYDFSEESMASADVLPGDQSPSQESLKALLYDTAEASRDRCLGAAVEVALAIIQGPSAEMSHGVVKRPGGNSRIIVCAGGPNTYGPGSVPHSFSHPNYPHMEKTALKWMDNLGRKAHRLNTVVDILCAGTCPVRVQIVEPLAKASGGVLLLYDDFGEAFGVNLQRAAGRVSGSHGLLEIRCSDDITISQVVGPGEEAHFDARETFKNDTSLAIQMLSVEETQSFALSMESKRDIKSDYVFFQFAVQYSNVYQAEISRVLTVRLPTVDGVSAYLDSIQNVVAAILIAKRTLLRAKTFSDAVDMRTTMDERIKDIALKFGSQVPKSKLNRFPKELCLLPELLFLLRRGPLLGSIVGHEDELSVLCNLFLNASFDLSLRMVAPRCLMHREGGTFEELPAYDLAMQSDTAVVLDHGIDVFIWLGAELAANEGRSAAALAACRTLAEEITESRFPAPRILAFKAFFEPEIEKMKVQECSFPLFVSSSALEKEKDRVEGFAPEESRVSLAGRAPIIIINLKPFPPQKPKRTKEWHHYYVTHSVSHCPSSVSPFPEPSFLSHQASHKKLYLGSSFFGAKPPRKLNCGARVSRVGNTRGLGKGAVVASLGGLLGGIFKGTDTGESTRQQYAPTVSIINGLEAEMSALSDSGLRDKTSMIKERAQGGESLDSLLPEAFAVVREASKRVLGLRPFDVQLIGGMVLHMGEIAEMRTGEGKTLVAILPAYLNALSGKGVHVVTVNDYLARRDCEWVGQVPRFLGLKSVGELVVRGFNYRVIDEVDSILIDEARTPLIISGPAEKPSDAYYKAAKIAAAFERDIHYTVDEKQKILLTEGHEDAEEILNVKDLYDPREQWASYVLNAIKAKELFLGDVNYIIRGKEVLIVDEFTGRVMQGRRWSDGLHQAVEAKEGLPIQNETGTLASISYQNFFLQFPKLCGMTSTAATESTEFESIYKLKVTIVPTNKPMIRKVCFTALSIDTYTICCAFDSLINSIPSQDESEVLSRVMHYLNSYERLAFLMRKNHATILTGFLILPYIFWTKVLNAKPENVEREAEIVAQSGRLGAATIATNMAGRGSDIILGGNAEFMARLKLHEILMPRVVKLNEGEYVSVKKLPANKTWKVNESLFPCKLSTENTKLAEEAVQLAVISWGQRSLTELEAEERLSYSCEKGPVQDEVIAKLRSAFLEIVKEYKIYTEEERKKVCFLLDNFF